MDKPNPFENQILLGDCLEWLDKIPEGSIDLIFADPPYALAPADLLANANLGRLLVDEGLLLLEHSRRQTAPERCGRLELLESRRYGESMLSIYGTAG